MNNILVITSIVLKELVRRKDAYVLLIITVLLTLLSGSVNIFGDLKTVRYVKELCLLLVWICSIVIAVTRSPSFRCWRMSSTRSRETSDARR